MDPSLHRPAARRAALAFIFVTVLIDVLAFGVIIPVLAIAGSLASRQRLSANAGTMPTHGPLFVGLLAGAVILVGILNYVPALALGPVVEHLQLFAK